MKKVLLVISLVLVVLLVACNKSDGAVIKSDTWKSLVNNEWSNFDNWAGTAFYFNEKEETAYCTFMIYGSGVRVMDSYESKVDISDDGSILIMLPEYLSTGYFKDVENLNKELVEVVLKFNDGSITFNEKKFKIHDGVSNYEYITDSVD